MSNVIQALKERDFIDSITSDELFTKTENPITLYLGFDPTAESLHLGNLVGIVALEWFKRFGHTVIALVGGATGKIGDPSGKSIERPLLTEEIIQVNVAKIKKQLSDCLSREEGPGKVILLDNYDWFSDMPIIDFLRDVGKHFRLGPMLSKESVKVRLQSKEGMSFTEFSYLLLQAYDFYYLEKNHGTCLQLGGSDQWGNITAGIDLTRRLSSKSVYGLTFPLLTRSDGKKFGKTEGGAIWLSEQLCSPYQFYQYLFSIPDSDVPKMMRMLTFMDPKEIDEYANKLQSGNFSPNEAQTRLADEVTRFVHGEEGLKLAHKVTSATSPGSKATLTLETLIAVEGDMPSMDLKIEEVLGAKYADLAVKGGLLSSKNEANRMIKSGGAYLNDEKILDPSFSVTAAEIIGGKYVLIGAGKKKKLLIKIGK